MRRTAHRTILNLSGRPAVSCLSPGGHLVEPYPRQATTTKIVALLLPSQREYVTHVRDLDTSRAPLHQFERI